MFRLGAGVVSVYRIPRETRKLENIGNSLGIMWQISKLPDIMRNDIWHHIKDLQAEGINTYVTSCEIPPNVIILNIIWTSRASSRSLHILKRCHRRDLNFLSRILGRIQTKVLRVFLLAIHSHLYSFALRFLFLQTHATSYSFYSALLCAL